MIEYTKVHGNGNDFVVLDNLDGRRSSADLSRLARLLCRRKFSLGADGILVTEAAEEGADFTMRIFNSDGSEGETCGNGARALARYAFEKKLAGASMRFMTLAGLVQAQVEPPYAELDMGEVPLLGRGVFGGVLKVRDREFPFLFLTVGIPHCVLKLEDYGALGDDLKFEVGREISHDYARFPKGTNVTFAQAKGRAIRAVTYERGVENLTLSCGTGCAAAALALSFREVNLPQPGVPAVFQVQNPGGTNEIRLDFALGHASCRVWLKGRTAMVAEGQIFEDALYEGESA